MSRGQAFWRILVIGLCVATASGVRAQEPEDLFLYHIQVFHFSHEPVGRFCQVLQQVIITELVMRDQVQEPGITLQIGSQIHFPMDDLIEIINRFFKFASTLFLPQSQQISNSLFVST